MYVLSWLRYFLRRDLPAIDGLGASGRPNAIPILVSDLDCTVARLCCIDKLLPGDKVARKDEFARLETLAAALKRLGWTCNNVEHCAVMAVLRHDWSAAIQPGSSAAKLLAMFVLTREKHSDEIEMAIAAIGQIGDSVAVDALASIAIEKPPGWESGVAAVKAIRRIANQAALDGIIRIGNEYMKYHSGWLQIQDAVIEALGDFPCESSAKALVDGHFHTTSDDQRRRCCESLVRIGAAAVEPLLVGLDPDGIADREMSTMREHLQLISTMDMRPEVRLLMASHLGRQFEKGDDGYLDERVDTVLRIGPPAVPVLERAIAANTLHPKVRVRVEEALERLRPVEQRIRDFVARAAAGPAFTMLRIDEFPKLFDALVEELKTRGIAADDIVNQLAAELVGICPRCKTSSTGHGLAMLAAIKATGVQDVSFSGNSERGKRLVEGRCHNENCDSEGLLVFFRYRDPAMSERLSRLGLSVASPSL